jgi:hypothetical protein
VPENIKPTREQLIEQRDRLGHALAWLIAVIKDQCLDYEVYFVDSLEDATDDAKEALIETLGEVGKFDLDTDSVRWCDAEGDLVYAMSQDALLGIKSQHLREEAVAVASKAKQTLDEKLAGGTLSERERRGAERLRRRVARLLKAYETPVE